MITRLSMTACILLAAGPALAQQPTFQDALLDRLVGHWVLEGTIAGKKTTHDVSAEWVLNHQFVLVREVSREKDAKGQPEYQANVYLGWDEKAAEHLCIWLDVWGGFSPETVGRAKRAGDVLAYVFKDKDGRPSFHTTFAYDRTADAWTWQMDNDDKGVLKPFARMKLARQRDAAAAAPPSEPSGPKAAGAAGGHR